uniref:Uncharacterized protein n=2 Tax=Pseudoalteromonas rubra TaxID=43658 RepID=A0A0F4QH07_9GAMM|nr:hypothetical protein TW77_20860 [Pseudoalteromonas rubra]
MGGNTIGTLNYKDDSSDSIQAGDGFILSGALNYTLNQQFDIRFNGAHHFDSANAKNGDVTFSRFALETIPTTKAMSSLNSGWAQAWIWSLNLIMALLMTLNSIMQVHSS